MHVLRKYLDTRNATIAVLEDFPIMENIITTSNGCARVDDEPFGSSHRRIENQSSLEKNRNKDKTAYIDDAQFDLYHERYEQACQYMEWFTSAWQILSEDDRYVLSIFFLGDGSQEERVKKLCQHFYIERDSAYRRKNRALKRLASALFG